MRIVAYIFSFIAFFILAVAIVFKVQHWAGSALMLIFGYAWSALAGLFILIHKLIERKKRNKPEEKSISPDKSNQNILDA